MARRARDPTTSNIRVVVERLQAVGDDRVLALQRLSVVSEGGVPGEQLIACVYDLVGTKLRRIHVYLDRAEALEAVGLRE